MKEFFILIITLTQEMMFIIMVLISVALFTLLERKILGCLQLRKGPNKITMMGMLQPFADALKLMSKDDSSVLWSNSWVFYLAPMQMMILGLMCWGVYPFVWGMIENSYSLITILVVYGLTVYGVMWSGWSSNSTYSMLGAMRAVCQSVSYEVVFGFIILCIISMISSFSISILEYWKLTVLMMLSPFLFMIMFISLIIEMGRTPFDLPEGESELVSGYSVEYGGGMFVFVFLSENLMVFFSSFIMSIFIVPSSSLIISMMVFMIALIRGVFPRIRYDHLMNLCWKLMTPFVLLLYNLNFLIIKLI